MHPPKQPDSYIVKCKSSRFDVHKKKARLFEPIYIICRDAQDFNPGNKQVWRIAWACLIESSYGFGYVPWSFRRRIPDRGRWRRTGWGRRLNRRTGGTPTPRNVLLWRALVHFSGGSSCFYCRLVCKRIRWWWHLFERVTIACKNGGVSKTCCAR